MASDTQKQFRLDSVPVLAPPKNFGIVYPGIYRSNAFDASSFAYIRSLRLRSAVYISPEMPLQGLQSFFGEEQIQFHNFGLVFTNKESSWKPIGDELIKETIEFVLNANHYPVMILCSTGIHETGALIGCLRRCFKWNMTSILEEYRRFAKLKTRDTIEQLIELFDTDLITTYLSEAPLWMRYHDTLLQEEVDQAAALTDSTVPYKQYLLSGQGPLVSSGVTYDVEKTICIDED